jgi:hypothetical protein
MLDEERPHDPLDPRFRLGALVRGRAGTIAWIESEHMDRMNGWWLRSETGMGYPVRKSWARENLEIVDA